MWCHLLWGCQKYPVVTITPSPGSAISVLFLLCTPFLHGTVVVLPSRCPRSVPHLSRLLADTLFPARHAPLYMLINLEDRRPSLPCKQCKHSTGVDTYDVEIVTVRNLSPTKSSYPLTSHRVLANVPRHGWRYPFWTLQWFETITGTEMRIDEKYYLP